MGAAMVAREYDARRRGSGIGEHSVERHSRRLVVGFL